MKLKATIAALVTLLASSAGATELSAFYWLLKPTGDASIGKRGIIGTKFNMKDDLGYSDDIGAPGGTLVLGDTIQFGISVFRAEDDSVETISRNITFRDLNFKASSRVSSEFDATIGRAFLRMQTPTDGFHIGLEAGALYTGLSAQAEATGVGAAKATAHAGMPYLGANLSLHPVSIVSLHAEGRISKWEISDFDVEFLDLEVSGRLHLEPLFIGGGYRSTKIAVLDEKKNIDVDIRFTGPVVYAGFEW